MADQGTSPRGRNVAGAGVSSGGAIWSAPTLDLKRRLIYVGTGNSYTDVETGHTDAIVAFEMDTGKIKWVNQVSAKDNFLVGCRQPGVGNCPDQGGPDHDFGSSPVLRKLPNGRQILLGGQKSGVMWAFDPDNNGKVLWQVKVGGGGALGGIEWGFAADAENVLKQTDTVIAGLDIARSYSATNPIAANDKLTATLTILQAVQSYINARKVAS